MQPNPTAAILVIGDEILSGRTHDTNTNEIAKTLTAMGIDLREARVVPDVQTEIVAALNALRNRYTYVFTTGGIGPTHDDITADAVAAAFGVSIDFHPEAMAMLAARYKPGDFNEMRKRMARIPATASLIKNLESTAPGFQIGNVFVMAGVPRVMRSMMEDVVTRLESGAVVHATTLEIAVPEGMVAAELASCQERHPDVAIGSYPFYRDTGPGVQLVFRGRDAELISAAVSDMKSRLSKQNIEFQDISEA